MDHYISPEAQAAHAQAMAVYAVNEQKRNQTNTIRFVINFPILMAVLYALHTVGFITIITDMESGLAGLLTTVAIIALILMVIRKFANAMFGWFIIFTCCTGLLFIPVFHFFVGYVSLWAISVLFPGMLQMPASLLVGIFAGLIIGIGQIPELPKPAAPEALKSPAQQAKEAAEKAANK